MNQILSVDNTPKDYNKKVKNKTQKIKKNNNGGPADIKSVLRFFSVALLIFGAFIIGSGSYSMYKESQTGTTLTKPTISIEEYSDTEKTLKIAHDKPLNKVTYKWNDGSENYVDSYGKKNVEQKIEVPSGTNKLTVYANDVNGEETTFSKTYTLQGKINIEFEVVGNNMKIITSGEDELSYMTYRWNDEEETKVEINDTEKEQLVEIPKGENTLTVIVVDINNNSETKEQDVKAVTKPKIEIKLDEETQENFVVKVTDEKGLKVIYFDIDEGLENSKKVKQEFKNGEKEFEFPFKLHEGENRIKVRAYNTDEIEEIEKAKVVK